MPVIPYIGHLCVYECWVYVLYHNVKRGNKFASCSVVGQLVGYKSTNIYLI